MRILIKALPFKEKYIPFWELPTKIFDEGDEDEKVFFHAPDNEYRRILDGEMKDVYYDPHTKEIDSGIVLNVYRETTYKEGEEIFYEVGDRFLETTTITGIEWEFQYQSAHFGKKAREYYGEEFPDFDWKDDQLYNIITWSPRYNTKDLKDSIWDYRIYRKR